MKRLICTVLSVLTLAAALASCGAESAAPAGNASSAATAAAPAETVEVTEAETEPVVTEPSAYDYLVKEDYDGYGFRVVAPTASTRYFPGIIIPEEYTGEIIYDAAYDRNAAVEEYFNTKMVYVSTESKDDCTAFVRSSVLSGEDAVDLAYNTLVRTGVLASEGMTLDARTLPNLNLDMPWYSQNVNDTITIGGKLKMICSDYSCLYLANIYCFFFNQDMAYKEFHLPDLYEETMNGEWTIDHLTKYCENVNADLDGDGVMTEDDRWAFTVGYGNSATCTNYTALQYGMGQFTTQTAADGGVSLVLNSERETSIIEKLDYLVNGLPMLKENKNDKTVMATFARSNVLFLTCIIMHAPNYMRDMTDEYGVLPLPKFDEAQDEYYTTVAQDSGMIEVIPITVTDTARTSAIYEALVYEGHNRVVPAFFETSMKVKYSRDEMSSQIFDLLRGSVVTDFGLVYDGGVGMNTLISKVIYSGKASSFSAEYAKIEAKTLAQYQSVMDSFNS